jgi:hypothetical protein
LIITPADIISVVMARTIPGCPLPRPAISLSGAKLEWIGLYSRLWNAALLAITEFVIVCSRRISQDTTDDFEMTFGDRD